MNNKDSEISNLLWWLSQYNGGTIRGAQVKLAKELGVSEATISRWFNFPEDYKPPMNKLLQIAKLLNKTPEDIADAFGIKRKLIPADFTDKVEATPLTKDNTITLPILADVPAGLPEWSDRDVEMFFDIPRWMFAGADFVVRCIGDSLAPSIKKGDFCVIRKETEPIEGRAMLVRTDTGLTMKKIHKLPDGTIELHSINQNYQPFVAKSLEIIGLIIGHWRKDSAENL